MLWAFLFYVAILFILVFFRYGLYFVLQVQSLLLGIKTIIEYVLICAIVIMVVLCCIPFHKTWKAAIVKTGENMV